MMFGGSTGAWILGANRASDMLFPSWRSILGNLEKKTLYVREKSQPWLHPHRLREFQLPILQPSMVTKTSDSSTKHSCWDNERKGIMLALSKDYKMTRSLLTGVEIRGLLQRSTLAHTLRLPGAVPCLSGQTIEQCRNRFHI